MTASVPGCASTPGTARRQRPSPCATRERCRRHDSTAATAFVWTSVVGGHPVIGAGVAVGKLARPHPQAPRPPDVRLVPTRHDAATCRRRARSPRRCGGHGGRSSIVGALVSRRMRWIALASVVADIRASPTDIAYGWGVWRGMARHRTLAPITPRLSAWPGRQPRPT